LELSGEMYTVYSRLMLSIDDVYDCYTPHHSVPSSLRAVQSLTTFRRRLKAELFESFFT